MISLHITQAEQTSPLEWLNLVTISIKTLIVLTIDKF
jgi:hypothetical protein